DRSEPPLTIASNIFRISSVRFLSPSTSRGLTRGYTISATPCASLCGFEFEELANTMTVNLLPGKRTINDLNPCHAPPCSKTSIPFGYFTDQPNPYDVDLPDASLAGVHIASYDEERSSERCDSERSHLTISMRLR